MIVIKNAGSKSGFDTTRSSVGLVVAKTDTEIQTEMILTSSLEGWGCFWDHNNGWWEPGHGAASGSTDKSTDIRLTTRVMDEHNSY